MTAGYSGTPLPTKLGIGPTSRVLVLGAERSFDLGVRYDQARDGTDYDVVILFCADLAALDGFQDAAAAHTVTGSVWVCWPKKASGVATDITEDLVREYGLTHGRVDVKVAAIDATWSGLKFVIRRADRPKPRTLLEPPARTGAAVKRPAR